MLALGPIGSGLNEPRKLRMIVEEISLGIWFVRSCSKNFFAFALVFSSRATQAPLTGRCDTLLHALKKLALRFGKLIQMFLSS